MYPEKTHRHVAKPLTNVITNLMVKVLIAQVVVYRIAKRIFGPQGKRKHGPPHPILQIMILKLSRPRCVISKGESVQQK